MPKVLLLSPDHQFRRCLCSLYGLLFHYSQLMPFHDIDKFVNRTISDHVYLGEFALNIHTGFITLHFPLPFLAFLPFLSSQYEFRIIPAWQCGVIIPSELKRLRAKVQLGLSYPWEP